MTYIDPKVTYSDPKVTHSCPKLAYSYPRVTYSDPKLTYSDPKVIHSDPKHLPLPPPASPALRGHPLPILAWPSPELHKNIYYEEENSITSAGSDYQVKAMIKFIMGGSWKKIKKNEINKIN